VKGVTKVRTEFKFIGKMKQRMTRKEKERPVPE
jgi:hypothetical protein